MTPTTPPRHPTWAEKFLSGVFWTCLSVAANFFTGFFLAPYTVRKLGDQGYGVWALAFSLIEYFILFDLGFRSAVVNFNSRHRANGNDHGINQVINTALVYFSVVAIIIVSINIIFADKMVAFFNIQQPAHRRDLAILIRMIGTSWAFGIISNIFQASLEAFQAFKIQNRINIGMLVLRSVGMAVCLYLGFGLITLGGVVVITQMLGYILTFVTFYRLFPALRFGRDLVESSQFRRMTSYGIPSFFANSSSLFLNQGPPVLIGHFLPEAFVGFFTIPSRLLQYMVELITRIGFVTAPNTTEMATLGRTDQILKLGKYLNRYCFALFAPLGIFLTVYGTELIRLWVGPLFAVRSAPLMPAFILMTAIAIAGQYNSTSILFGLARHRPYAMILMVEALLSVVGLTIVIPRYGIMGAAWVVSGLAIVSRGFATPWMLCRILKASFLEYMAFIYVRPALVAAVVLAVGFALKSAGLLGSNWRQLFLALSFISATYYTLAYAVCLDAEHRRRIHQWLAGRVSKFSKNPGNPS